MQNSMSKKNLRKISSDDKMKCLDILWTCSASLKTREEVKNFFKDLLTPSESIMLGRRLQIAKMLLEGKSYDFIGDALGAGRSTIASVHQWLSSGFGGYEKVLQKFEAQLKKRFERLENDKDAPMSFGWLKKKYPLHFLLFNLLDRK